MLLIFYTFVACSAIFPIVTTSFCSSCANPVVETPLGNIEGYYADSVNGRKYAAFEGIPYAKPPVAEYRYEEPRPITEPWIGTWPAKTLHTCLQYYHFTGTDHDFVIGDEDCLYVNVYVPPLENGATLDVIVYIHGGAFMFNSGGTYGPKILMDRDVIYVSLNYRLGPLGFLSTEDDILPGNLGIHDQIAALKWIKENIKYFGGNPSSITITGMSAGGASVQLHYLSPLSKGLFNRGFSMSGVTLNPWVLVENSLEKAKKLADIVGCPTKPNKAMVNCLKYRPGRQIVNAVKHFMPWLYNPFSPFGVVIDKWSTKPVLPEHPYILLKEGKVLDLPWIASNVESEGLYPAADFITDEKYLDDINTRWNEIIPFLLDYNNTVAPKDRDLVSQKIRQEYFQGREVSKETFPVLVQLISDRIFNYDIQRGVHLHNRAVKSPVYYYHFAYRGAHSKSESRASSAENYGTSHGDDTVYVLSSVVDTQSNENDRKMSRIFVDMWMSYASGRLPPSLPNGLTWPEVSKSASGRALEYLLIKGPNDLEFVNSELLGNYEFWNSLPLKENEKLLKVRDEFPETIDPCSRCIVCEKLSNTEQTLSHLINVAAPDITNHLTAAHFVNDSAILLYAPNPVKSDNVMLSHAAVYIIKA